MPHAVLAALVWPWTTHRAHFVWVPVFIVVPTQRDEDLRDAEGLAQHRLVDLALEPGGVPLPRALTFVGLGEGRVQRLPEGRVLRRPLVPLLVERVGEVDRQPADHARGLGLSRPVGREPADKRRGDLRKEGEVAGSLKEAPVDDEVLAAEGTLKVGGEDVPVGEHGVGREGLALLDEVEHGAHDPT